MKKTKFNLQCNRCGFRTMSSTYRKGSTVVRGHCINCGCYVGTKDIHKNKRDNIGAHGAPIK